MKHALAMAEELIACYEQIECLKKERSVAVDLLKECMTGSCWCQVGVDNPMMKGRHTPKCNQIRLFLSQCEEK